MKVINLYTSSVIRPIVKSLLRYKKSGSVLDLGAGYGRHSLFLARKGFEITAVEISRKVAARLKESAKRKHLAIRVIIKNIATLKLNTKYDIILATMSLHFLRKKEIRRVINLMQRHTETNGLNVVSSYTDQNPLGTRPYQFQKNELKKYYKGWELLQYREGLGFPSRLERYGKIHRSYSVNMIARKRNG